MSYTFQHWVFLWFTANWPHWQVSEAAMSAWVSGCSGSVLTRGHVNFHSCTKSLNMTNHNWKQTEQETLQCQQIKWVQHLHQILRYQTLYLLLNIRCLVLWCLTIQMNLKGILNQSAIFSYMIVLDFRSWEWLSKFLFIASKYKKNEKKENSCATVLKKIEQRFRIMDIEST